jgi:hypothetical protein
MLVTWLDREVAEAKQLVSTMQMSTISSLSLSLYLSIYLSNLSSPFPFAQRNGSADVRCWCPTLMVVQSAKRWVLEAALLVMSVLSV